MTDAATLPDFARLLPNLAEARLGAAVVACSDDYFAEAARMLDHTSPRMVPGLYDDHGKWMDGWESRRKRGPGHDWCVVRLAVPAHLTGFDIDTANFTGNYPHAAMIEAWFGAGDPPPDAVWQPVLPAMPLGPDSRHIVPCTTPGPWSHLRLSIYPDGGVARFRVYGRAALDPADRSPRDFASVLSGGRVLAASNIHYRSPSQMLLPGRGANMGEGWETRRRREPGFDWVVLALGQRCRITAVEIDTSYNTGNYPHACALWADDAPALPDAAAAAAAMWWPRLMPEVAMQPGHLHCFESELADLGPVTHLRLDVIPDGGIHRLRVWGDPA